MRISDWSSDVCSSDLELFARPPSPNPNPKPNTFSSSQDDGKQDTWPFILRCTTPSGGPRRATPPPAARSEEHTSELQPLMRISYAVFSLKNKNTNTPTPSIYILVKT